MGKFGMKPKKRANWSEWKKYISRINKPRKTVTVGIVNKYVVTGSFKLADCFISVSQSLLHAGAELGVGIKIKWIDAQSVENAVDPSAILGDCDGILVPGGFGKQGFEGMIKTARYARENNVPYLGLCFGMQLAVCEFARNVCGLEGASSTEIDTETSYPVINIIESQIDTLAKQGYGGTMRLGAYAAMLEPGTKIHEIYEKSGRIAYDKARIDAFAKDPCNEFRLGIFDHKKPSVLERHRHRYEVNPKYIDILTSKGLVFSGHHVIEDGTKLMEFIELKDHKCFIATQGHPEFTSRLGRSNPMFKCFVEAAASEKKNG